MAYSKIYFYLILFYKNLQAPIDIGNVFKFVEILLENLRTFADYNVSEYTKKRNIVTHYTRIQNANFYIIQILQNFVFFFFLIVIAETEPSGYKFQSRQTTGAF